MKVILADPAIRKALVSVSPTSRQNHKMKKTGTFAHNLKIPEAGMNPCCAPLISLLIDRIRRFIRIFHQV